MRCANTAETFSTSLSPVGQMQISVLCSRWDRLPCGVGWPSLCAVNHHRPPPGHWPLSSRPPGADTELLSFAQGGRRASLLR